MKKHSLLGAAALSTVAFAGVANAQTLSPAANPSATVTTRAIVATESQLTAEQRVGVVGLEYKVGAGTPSALSKLTLSLTGGATFSDTASATKAAGSCSATFTLSTGGAKGDTSATYLVEGLDQCTTTGLKFNLPVQLAAGSTTAVNVNASLTTELGTPIAAGTANTNTGATNGSLINFAKSIVVATNADAVSTRATLASQFKALATGASSPVGDNVIGTVVITDNAYRAGINNDDQVKLGATGSYSDTTFTVRGDLTNLDVFLTPTGGTATKVVQGAATGEGTVKFTPSAATTYTVTVAETGSTPARVIPGGAYDISTRLTPNAGALVNPVNAGPSSLQPVTREGASYLIPWVASGTLAQASTSNTVIRISNLNNAAVGRVSAELLTNSGGVANSTTLVQLAPSIAGRGEFIITSASLEAALGNFGRGDIRITVETAGSNLVVRRFVQSTTNGALSEVSLGRTATGGGSEPLN